MKPLSTPGLVLSGLYVIASAYLIFTQGLFGESFIALILGLPWSMLFSLVEFGNVTGALLHFLVLAPIVLNAFVLYWAGYVVGRVAKKG